MNKLIVIAAIVFLSGVAACSDGNSESQLVPEPAVRLEGTIGLSTRGVIDSGYEGELKVGFARQDETAASAESYGAWRICKAVREGGAGSRPIVFDEPQWYPSDGRTIHLHGYYPAGAGTLDPQTGKATFTVDGKTDIMATGCLSASTYEPVRTCTFRHLLTQIAWVCYGDRAELWGAVTKIAVVEVHTRQELDYGLESPSLADVSSGDGIQDLLVQDIAGLPVPFAPVHLLFINLLTDSLPAIALGLEPHTKDVMNEKPRPMNESILTKPFLMSIGTEGLVIGIMTMAAFMIGYGQSGSLLASTMAFGTLCMSRLVHGFNCKAAKPVIFTKRFFNNIYLIGAFLIGFALITAVMTIPALQGMFKVVTLNMSQLLTVYGLALLNLPVIQLLKWIRNKANHK